MRIMGFKTIEIAATLILNLIHCAYSSDHILSCNVTSLHPCPGNNQVCNQTVNECVCLDGFVRAGSDCEVLVPDQPTSHAATVAVVAVLTLALLVSGLVLVIRKYNLVDYVRQKIDMRRNNDVMYEDVMIGQDDPPLSP